MFTLKGRELYEEGAGVGWVEGEGGGNGGGWGVVTFSAGAVSRDSGSPENWSCSIGLIAEGTKPALCFYVAATA